MKFIIYLCLNLNKVNVKLQILKSELLKPNLLTINSNLNQLFDNLKEAEISSDNFSFYTSVASVYSSKIEGEDIELDSYIKHKKFGIEFLPDYTKKIDDLYSAYLFAQKNRLNKENIEKAHQILSKHFVVPQYQGRLRTQNMFVANNKGEIEYVTATPFELENEMKKFYQDIEALISVDLSFEETFYFASMIHLVLVKIHPWNDGNGRSARLLEKWFLSEKLGVKAWFIESEKFYYHNIQTYYKNLRLLGLEYNLLDYSKSLPFLWMLLESLK